MLNVGQEGSYEQPNLDAIGQRVEAVHTHSYQKQEWQLQRCHTNIPDESSPVVPLPTLKHLFCSPVVLVPTSDIGSVFSSIPCPEHSPKWLVKLSSFQLTTFLNALHV